MTLTKQRFSSGHTVAQRTEFNVDGLLLTATDVYNGRQRQKASSMNIGKTLPRSSERYANPLYASIHALCRGNSTCSKPLPLFASSQAT